MTKLFATKAAKIAFAALATAVTVGTTTLSTSTPAEARNGWAVAAGVGLGLGIAGIAGAALAAPYYAPPPAYAYGTRTVVVERTCYRTWRTVDDGFRVYRERVRVCE